jgi:hypothetical protein
MSKDNESFTESMEQVVRAHEEVLNDGFNELTSKTIDFMYEEIKALELSKAQQLQLLLLVAEAVVFNFVMHMAEHTEMDPRKLAKHSKQNLQNAVLAVVQPAPGEAIH